MIVTAYDVFNNEHDFPVESVQKGREYAKRIIMEGLWYIDGEDEVFLPVHQLVKVKIHPDNTIGGSVAHNKRRKKRKYTRHIKVE